MFINKSSVGAGSLLVAVLAAGCSAGVTNAQPATAPPPATTVVASAPATNTPSQEPSASPSPDSTAATSYSTAGAAAKLPPEFPLPDGAEVTLVTRQPNQIAATMTVPDGGKALDFWRSKLPAAGYKISHTDAVNTFGEIRFSGHGCADNSQLGISNTTVAFQCDLD